MTRDRTSCLQMLTRVKQKFKVRIEDPPRRRHMVFLGGAVLANIVSLPENLHFREASNTSISDGRQGEHVDIQGRVARTRCPCPGQVGRSMKKRRRIKSHPKRQLTKFHQINTKFCIFHPTIEYGHDNNGLFSRSSVTSFREEWVPMS